MRIGILQCGHVPDVLIADHGDYDQMFQQFLAGRGFSFDAYPVVDGVFPDGVHAAEGWLLTGSRYGAYEDHAWIPELEAFIRAAYAADIPMVGICFGHQIIAQALGGRVEKFSGGWAVGPKTYRMGGAELRLNAWHQDQVVELPTGAEPIAENAFCAYPALVYGKKALTYQPHPEIRPAYLQGLIDKRGPGLVPAPLLDKATEENGMDLDDGQIADQIARFFKERRYA